MLNRKDYFYFAGFAILILIIFFQKCSSDKNMEDIATQIGRLNDTTVIYREVDGKQVADTKAAGLTINEYRAADPNNFAEFAKIITKKDDLIHTLILEIQNERRKGEADVIKDTGTGIVTVPYEDSCISLKTTIPKEGKATIDYQIKELTFRGAAVMRREKWYKSKQPVAVGSISSGCGKITSQKIVLVNPEKKKVYETNLFKAGAVIVIFEAIRFGITGKL